jgi:hypothetical protein
MGETNDFKKGGGGGVFCLINSMPNLLFPHLMSLQRLGMQILAFPVSLVAIFGDMAVSSQ